MLRICYFGTYSMDEGYPSDVQKTMETIRNLCKAHQEIQQMESHLKYFISKLRKASVLLGMVILGVVIVYLPIINNYFSSDDFHHLLVAKEASGFWNMLFTASPGSGQHLHPFLRLLFFGEFNLFGVNATGYYLVNILVHIINVFLIAYLYRLLTEDRVGSVCAAALFGLSASHWRAVMWISTVSHLMSTFWFLIATITFIFYIKNGRLWVLIISSISHLCMLLFFTNGIEVPLLYGIYLIIGATWSETPVIKHSLKKYLLLAPYIINDGIYLLLRKLFLPSSVSVIATAGGNLWDILNTIKQAIPAFLGGLYEGYFRSFMGLYGIAEIDLTLYPAIIVLILLVLLAGPCLYKKPLLIRLAACMLIWMSISYFIPSMFRSGAGADWFFARSRYRYFPGVAASLATIIIFRSFGPFTRSGRWYWARTVLWLLFLGVLLSNAFELSRQEHITHNTNNYLKHQIALFLKDFKKLPSGAQVLDVPISEHLLAGHNVTPSLLVRFYAPPNAYNDKKFLNKEDWNKRDPSLPSFVFTRNVYQLKSLR